MIASKLPITARKLAALAKNAAAIPHRATIQAAKAGPTIREPWKLACRGIQGLEARRAAAVSFKLIAGGHLTVAD